MRTAHQQQICVTYREGRMGKLLFTLIFGVNSYLPQEHKNLSKAGFSEFGRAKRNVKNLVSKPLT